MDHDHLIGQIALRSVLGIKYRILLKGHPSTTFRLPLFTRQFWGDTNLGPSIWVVVGPLTMQWNVLLQPRTLDRGLVASIAFIHNRWWSQG